jgi:uncharacterized protein YrzB (UPF0473 family)
MEMTVTVKCENEHREKVLVTKVGYGEDGELEVLTSDDLYYCFTCEGLGLDSYRTEVSQDEAWDEIYKKW